MRSSNESNDVCRLRALLAILIPYLRLYLPRQSVRIGLLGACADKGWCTRIPEGAGIGSRSSWHALRDRTVVGTGADARRGRPPQCHYHHRLLTWHRRLIMYLCNDANSRWIHIWLAETFTETRSCQILQIITADSKKVCLNSIRPECCGSISFLRKGH